MNSEAVDISKSAEIVTKRASILNNMKHLQELISMDQVNDDEKDVYRRALEQEVAALERANIAHGKTVIAFKTQKSGDTVDSDGVTDGIFDDEMAPIMGTYSEEYV
jgi:hypothetical protein